MKSKSFVNVGSLIRFEEQSLPINLEVQIEPFTLGGEKVGVSSPVSFKGIARRLSKGVQVEGKFRAEVFLNCARCLEKFKLKVEGEVNELFALADYQAQLPEDLDYYLVQAENIDLGPMIKEQLVLAIPFKALCSESCLGLCPRCGKNLNKEVCSCQGSKLKVKSSSSKKSDLVNLEVDSGCSKEENNSRSSR